MGRELSNVYQYILVWMAVDESVGKEEHTLLCVKDVHCGKRIILFAYADNLLGYLDGVRVFSIQTCDESVGITSLNHHHTEVVALVHLIVSLLKGIALTSTLLCKMLGVCGTSTLFLVGTHIYKLNAVKVQLQAFSHTA